MPSKPNGGQLVRLLAPVQPREEAEGVPGEFKEPLALALYRAARMTVVEKGLLLAPFPGPIDR